MSTYTNYKESYWVGDEGDVLNTNYNKTGETRRLKEDVSPLGYSRVTLSVGGKTERHLLHRLVAEVYLSNPSNLPCVNHKNEVKSDNRAVNLEYCDYGYNTAYKNGYERRLDVRKVRGTAKTDPRPVIATSVKDGSEKRYDSIMDAIRDGFHNAGLAVRGMRPTCKGYRFRYVDNPTSET